jgi:hypothetical protein
LRHYPSVYPVYALASPLSTVISSVSEEGQGEKRWIYPGLERYFADYHW